MDTPQDLMKLVVPPAPAGKTATRGPAEITRKPEGGAEFAEVMRNAQASNRAEASDAETSEPTVREAPGREAQATRPERQPREVATEAEEAPVRVRGKKDAPADTPTDASSDGVAQVAAQLQSVQSAATQTSAPDNPSAQALNIALAGLAAAAGVPGGALPAPVPQKDAAGAQTLAPVGGSAPALDPRISAALQNQSGPAEVPEGQALPTPGLGSMPRSDAASTQLPAAAATFAAAAGTSASPSTDLTPRAPAAPAAPATPAATRPAAQPVALAPATAALAVDRAIGNALVSLPSTGNFRPADLAAPLAADPARIASAGFVAVALQTPAPENADAAPLPMSVPLSPDEAPAPSTWLTARPEALAITLADRALSQDPAAQAPLLLEQMVRALDSRVAGVASGMAAVAGASLTETNPSIAPAAAIDTPVNGALQLQTVGAPADSAPEPLTLSLNAPLQQADRWAAELGDRVAWVANNRMSAATLQVNPPQLGPIEVRILMSGDQAAVSFAAVQPQTREAIQQALPVLASSLASQGLSLGQASVGHDHLPQQGGQGGAGSSATSRPGELTNTVAATGGVAAGAPRTSGAGLVDTFA